MKRSTKIGIFGIIFVAYCSNTFAEKPKFYLYTKSLTQGKLLNIRDGRTIDKDSFIPEGQIKILCHGFQSSERAVFPRRTKDAYLNAKENVSVIVVDWENLASKKLGYDKATQNARLVGKEIAELMNLLVLKKNITTFDKFHFIGHSLGAQVGAFIQEHIHRRFGRITGLDPARPNFEPSKPKKDRLDSSDAKYVDVIYTSTGVGSKDTKHSPPSGHATFYPNGGVHQPGCLGDFMRICSHSRAYIYFTESIAGYSRKGFIACKCCSYEDYINERCGCHEKAFMGEGATPNMKGTFYLKTLDRQLFAAFGN